MQGAVPDVPFFKDWKDMIASGTVDAIITTVPHYLHHEISIYAMEHGMNVLCESPPVSAARMFRR